MNCTAIYAEKLPMTIKTTTIDKCGNDEARGGALELEALESATIEDNFFTNNEGILGG